MSKKKKKKIVGAKKAQGAENKSDMRDSEVQNGEAVESLPTEDAKTESDNADVCSEPFAPADTARENTLSKDCYGENREAEPDPSEIRALTAAPDVEIPRDPDFSEEDFRLSAKMLSAENIQINIKGKTDCKNAPETSVSAEKTTAKRKRRGAGNILQIALLTFFAAVALICAVMLVKNIKGKIDGAKVYNNAEFDSFVIGADTKNTFNHPTALAMLSGDTPMLSLYDRISAGKSPDNGNSGGKYAEKLAAMKASLTALKAKNPDVYGWIYAEGTTIDHPIMRGSDNDYYLNHAYTGEALPIGSIFLDYNTKDTLTDNYNAVIYGHNVVAVAGSKSSMFHDVTKFLDAEFFENNKIYIYTMDGVYIYKAVSVYPTTADYFYYRTEFPNEASFLKFAKEMVANSKVKSGETFSSGDTMITLSTCTNGASDGRYSLHAKLIEVIK